MRRRQASRGSTDPTSFSQLFKLVKLGYLFESITSVLALIDYQTKRPFDEHISAVGSEQPHPSAAVSREVKQIPVLAMKFIVLAIYLQEHIDTDCRDRNYFRNKESR